LRHQGVVDQLAVLTSKDRRLGCHLRVLLQGSVVGQATDGLRQRLNRALQLLDLVGVLVRRQRLVRWHVWSLKAAQSTRLPEPPQLREMRAALEAMERLRKRLN
jgi:hypothetical protein